MPSIFFLAIPNGGTYYLYSSVVSFTPFMINIQVTSNLQYYNQNLLYIVPGYRSWTIDALRPSWMRGALVCVAQIALDLESTAGKVHWPPTQRQKKTAALSPMFFLLRLLSFAG